MHSINKTCTIRPETYQRGSEAYDFLLKYYTHLIYLLGPLSPPGVWVIGTPRNVPHHTASFFRVCFTGIATKDFLRTRGRRVWLRIWLS